MFENMFVFGVTEEHKKAHEVRVENASRLEDLQLDGLSSLLEYCFHGLVAISVVCIPRVLCVNP